MDKNCTLCKRLAEIFGYKIYKNLSDLKIEEKIALG